MIADRQHAVQPRTRLLPHSSKRGGSGVARLAAYAWKSLSPVSVATTMSPICPSRPSDLMGRSSAVRRSDTLPPKHAQRHARVGGSRSGASAWPAGSARAAGRDWRRGCGAGERHWRCPDCTWDLVHNGEGICEPPHSRNDPVQPPTPGRAVGPRSDCKPGGRRRRHPASGPCTMRRAGPATARRICNTTPSTSCSAPSPA